MTYQVGLSTFSYFGAGACEACSGEGCEQCDQTRLGPVARGALWHGKTLHQWLDFRVGELQRTLKQGTFDSKNQSVIAEIDRRLGVLARLGLTEQRLWWRCVNLSGGEFQRLRLARLVGEPLTQVLYLLDEPAAGLDTRGVENVYVLCRELVSAGNTVVVVRITAIIERADWLVEFGPGPGKEGGQVVYAGAPAELSTMNTCSARWFAGDRQLPKREGQIDATRGKIRESNRELGVGIMGVLTGPAAVGKTRVLQRLESRGAAGELPFERVVAFGSQAVGRSARSTLATYCGLWDVLRPLLAATQAAQVRGLRASHFSLNTKGGRCERCKGTGEERVDLGVLPALYLVCSSCHGRRFHGDILAVRWKGLTATETSRCR